LRSYRIVEILQTNSRRIMRIALICDRIYPFYTGGYETLLSKMIAFLSFGNEITVFTTLSSTYNPNYYAENIEFVPIVGEYKYTNKDGQHGLLGAVFYSLSLQATVSKIKGFDLVFVSTIPYLGIAAILRRLSKENKKIISIFYEAWYYYSPSKNFRALTRHLFRNEIRKIVIESDSILSISKPTTFSLRHNYKAKQIVTMPMGIELEAIDQVPKPTMIFDVSFLGRIATIKRVQDLIRAIEQLKNTGVLIRAVVIGDGPALRYLKHLCRSTGVSDVVYFSGKVSDEEKYALLKSSKIFVLPSEREGFSIATLEAMACGCVPIVAVPDFPEIFGVSHYVKDEINGKYYEIGNIKMLASQIKMILSDQNKLELLSKKAVETARTYHWDVVLEKLRKMLI